MTAPAPARSPALWPFASDAPANTAIGANATFEDATGERTAALLAVRPYINHDRWSFAVYRAGATDPVADFIDPKTSLTQARGHVPVDAVPTPGTDEHIAIIQPDDTVIECWRFRRYDAHTCGASYIRTNTLTGSGIDTGTRASGTSILMGLIRAHEVTNGLIPHTLTLGLPDTALRVGFVWPARAEDGDGKTTYSGAVPMGTMFAIPAAVQLAGLGLSPAGLVLGRALQDYGAHVMLRAGNTVLFAEPACDADSITAMRTDWLKLHPLMRCLTNNAPGTVAGGGTRRRPAPPPLLAA
jgi:hypothetical protein